MSLWSRLQAAGGALLGGGGVASTQSTTPIAEPVSRGKRDYQEYEVLQAYVV